MKLANLINGLKIKKLAVDIDTDVKGVCYNSNKCKKDFIYFARKGFVYDGYSFLPLLKQKGVSVFFGEEYVDGYPFVVEDIKEAQAIVSANFYGNPQNYLKIIGVTGTNGKTTTCYLLKDALQSGLISTVEIFTGKSNQKAVLTTPESTDIFRFLKEMVEVGKEYAVVEVSAHALSLKRIFNLNFDAIVFTNFTQDHLDYYKTMDNYLNAKMRIFKLLKDDGFCVLNRDCSVFEKLKALCDKNVLTVGKGPENNVRIKEIRELENSLLISYLIGNRKIGLNFPLIGDYNAYNLGFAIGVLKGFNLNIEEFLRRVERSFFVPGRVETLKSRKGFSVIVDFAHTPDGLLNLLSSVRKHTKNKLITVFGCGGERDKKKRPLMLEAVCKFSDIVYVTADNPRNEDLDSIFNDIKIGITFGKDVNYVKDRVDAIFEAIGRAGKGDVVVLAGKGHEDYQIIKGERIPFSDKNVAMEALRFYEGK